MLKGMRKNTKVIVWTVIISFALWGGVSLGTQFQKKGRIAGEIFGKGVSFQEFDSFYKANQLFSFAGKSSSDAGALKRETWQSLIFNREARRRKINVSDDEVREEIIKLLAAQKLTDPTPEQYKRWLAATTHESPSEFESQIREILRIQKLVRQITDAAKPEAADEEIHKKFLETENKISGDVIPFSTMEEAKEFRGKIKNDGDWKKTAEQNKTIIKSTGLVSVANLGEMLSIAQDTAFDLHKLPQGAVSDPVVRMGGFVVFHVVDKQDADESKYEKEFKEKYRQAVLDKKKYENFLIWASTLSGNANLKDYMPGEDEPQEMPGVKTPPANPKAPA